MCAWEDSIGVVLHWKTGHCISVFCGQYTDEVSRKIIYLYVQMSFWFPRSSWSCQCPCGCGTVVKLYIIWKSMYWINVSQIVNYLILKTQSLHYLVQVWQAFRIMQRPTQALLSLCTVHTRSEAYSPEISDRSPSKLFIFIMKGYIDRIKIYQKSV